jgi:hypothetical protein
MTIQAIETVYRGHRFRSRLEARWAVFFDAVGIRYEYEPEGFEISTWDGDKRYLPDFRLTDLGTWVEVKGWLGDVKDGYLEMLAHAIDWGGQLPDVSDSWGTPRGLLWLGPIPKKRVCQRGTPAHVILQHHKGGWIQECGFVMEGGACVLSTSDVCEEYFDSSWGGNGSAEAIRPVLARVIYGEGLNFAHPCGGIVMAAYERARQARFEHGESPW